MLFFPLGLCVLMADNDVFLSRLFNSVFYLVWNKEYKSSRSLFYVFNATIFVAMLIFDDYIFRIIGLRISIFRSFIRPCRYMFNFK